MRVARSRQERTYLLLHVSRHGRVEARARRGRGQEVSQLVDELVSGVQSPAARGEWRGRERKGQEQQQLRTSFSDMFE